MPRTGEHRSRSPALDAPQGAYLASASRRNVPTSHGEAPQCPMSRRKFTCPASVARRLFQSSSVPSEYCPASCDEDTPRVKLMSRNALGPFWSMESFSPPCRTRSSRQGHRVAAGKLSRSAFSREGQPNKVYSWKYLTPSACTRGNIRYRIDDVGNMLASLYFHKTEVLLRHQIAHYLTREYDAECLLRGA